MSGFTTLHGGAAAVPPCGALRVRGVLRRSPFAGALYRAELGHVPMDKAHEYESVAMFERPCAAPVLLSPGQRYRLLDEVVAALRRHVPGLGIAAVRLYGPDFNVQLTAGLLAEDVVITHAPLRLVPSLRDAGLRDIAVVDHDLRADGLEQGANALALWLVAPTPDGLAGFARMLAGPGVWQALDDATLEPFSAEALDAIVRADREVLA